ncbi:MAG: hypothetical protein WC967_13125 [Balneolaceae bacterium]
MEAKGRVIRCEVCSLKPDKYRLTIELDATPTTNWVHGTRLFYLSSEPFEVGTLVAVKLKNPNDNQLNKDWEKATNLFENVEDKLRQITNSIERTLPASKVVESWMRRIGITKI